MQDSVVQKFNELCVKLRDLEDEVLPDELMIKHSLNSVKLLEQIFDYRKRKNNRFLSNVYGDLSDIERLLADIFELEKRKSEDIQKIRDLIYIGENHGFNWSSRKIHFFKNAFFHRFLRENKLGNDYKRLDEIIQYFEGRVRISSFEEHIPDMLPKFRDEYLGMLEEFLKILETNKEILRKHLYDILYSEQFIYNFERLVIHELLHSICKFDSSRKIAHDTTRIGIEESLTHALQVFSVCYKEDFVFSLSRVSKLIDQLLSMMETKETHTLYTGKHYEISQLLFMKCFSCYAAIIMICDAYKRKSGNFELQNLTRNLVSNTRLDIFRTNALKSLEHLDNRQLRNLLNKLLLRRGDEEIENVRAAIRKSSEDVIVQIEKYGKLGFFRIINLEAELKNFFDFCNIFEQLEPSEKSFVENLRQIVIRLFNEEIIGSLQKNAEEVKKLGKDEETKFSKELETFGKIKSKIREMESLVA